MLFMSICMLYNHVLVQMYTRIYILYTLTVTKEMH